MSLRKMVRLPARPYALVDFDGTIAPDDPTDRLFERFADPSWREIEAAWQSGKISSRQCMERQVALLRATPAELDREIRSVRVDPGFRTFLGYCRRNGIEAMVVSDGFDRVVRAVLAAAQVSIPFFANRLEWQGGDRWRLAFPHSQAQCLVGSANCKCSHGIGRLSRPIIAIGDGRSDFCMSTRADFVIAKGTLAAFCRSRGRDHQEFKTFDEVTGHLAAWLENSGLNANVQMSSTG